MKTPDILTAALSSLGYQCNRIYLGPDKKEFLQVANAQGEACLTMSAGSPLYPFATASTRLLSKDKAMAYDFAEQLGISIPKSVYISIDETSYSDAIQLLHERGPVIAKPTDSSLSNGVTLGIRTEGELTTALAFARKHSENVVVQQQVSGDEVRFPVVNGKVVAAILRQTPQIVGDGASTIQKLIHKENELRKNLPETIVPYPLLDEVLVPADLLTSQRIPAVGEVVELNRNTMIMGGASIYNVMNNIHPTYLALVEKLTRPLGKGFVVADVIIKDYTEPAEDNNYWFLEFNLTPAIKLFYSCRDGKHFRVAEDYLAPMIVKAIQ